MHTPPGVGQKSAKARQQLSSSSSNQREEQEDKRSQVRSGRREGNYSTISLQYRVSSTR